MKIEFTACLKKKLQQPTKNLTEQIEKLMKRMKKTRGIAPYKKIHF